MKAKILFVDDEERVVNLLKMMFRSTHEVFTATSGKAALAQLLPLESPAKEAEGLMLEVNVKSTSRLRRDASNCAVCTAAASCAALLLARFSAIKVEKDGMATAANTAITATVTISSINVNPRALTCGRSRITAGIADPF